MKNHFLVDGPYNLRALFVAYFLYADMPFMGMLYYNPNISSKPGYGMYLQSPPVKLMVPSLVGLEVMEASVDGAQWEILVNWRFVCKGHHGALGLFLFIVLASTE